MSEKVIVKNVVVYYCVKQKIKFLIVETVPFCRVYVMSASEHDVPSRCRVPSSL